ncbi:MAG: isoleucine--tRNA ligase [Eggerthellales bacterium]|nr:isoleucine--tRNA ligase [Eggerthellales bacterium]
MGNTYKQTMNLPQTDFPMRGSLPQNEPKRLEKWQEMDLYARVLEKNKDGEPFVLHDGPPYANGPIHIGHAFNKILKDIIVKDRAQRGYYAPYVPGWDCHGLPIENKVEDQLGPEKMKQIDTPTFRRICRDYATKQLDGQREGFKRLGVQGEWNNPYLTYLPEYEAGNIKIFKKLYLDGSIYRGRKPIHWCSHCHTALAEAEIEYADETSPSIYVKFLFTQAPAAFAPAIEAAGLEQAQTGVVIWTTTPWTLPANQAVSLAPDADYVMALVDGQLLLMAQELAPALAQTAGWGELEFLSLDGQTVVVKGDQLKGQTYVHPILPGETGVVLTGTHVTLDTGTGAVHTAPGHGVDDYKVCQANGIKDIKMPVDDEGRFYEGSCLWAGLSTNDANPQIIAWLKEQGTLVAHVDISHSYPHCWRCHEPVIFRATTQWFVSMDDTNLRANASRAITDQVTWYPAWASNRIGAMVQDRPDWCISRQRLWGVPIPVFKCAACGETVADEATFDAVIELFETKGADAWYSHEPKDFLPAGTICPHCGAGVDQLVSEQDVLDVWWESGVSHTSVCEARDYLQRPADVYLEGSDQHRGWFQSSLLTSVAAYGIPPYKNVVSCGFTVDENGEKMSKSKGNGIDPADVVAKFGADVLRLWVSSVDYSVDVRISESILKQVSDAYRKFRNSFRFLLGNLNDFDDLKDAVTSWDDLEPVDQYMMIQTLELLQEVEKSYDQFHFNGVYRAVYDFMNNASAIYMDVAKDRLYSEAPNSPRRRAVQTVLMNMLEVLVRILAPILSFTADEVWENYPEAIRTREGRPVTVFEAGWPAKADFMPAIPEDVSGLKSGFAALMDVREVVTKALEDARTSKVINKSQEAAVAVAAPDELLAVLQGFDAAVLEELFIVSKVELSQGQELSAVVSAATGEKCPRCWNVTELGGNPNHADVCKRCGDVLDQLA